MEGEKKRCREKKENLKSTKGKRSNSSPLKKYKINTIKVTVEAHTSIEF